MDALCLKVGIQGIAPPIAVAGYAGMDVVTSHPSQISAGGRPLEKQSVAAAQRRNFPWGFTFRDPLRSLWPGGKNRCEPAIAMDDAVLVEEKEEIKKEEREKEVQNGNWVFKILHVRSLWKEVDEREGKFVEEMGTKLEEEDKIVGLNGNYNDYRENGDCCEENWECDVCGIDEENDEKIEFDRESFSKLLRKVPLAEARLYAQMSYLANLAYSIPQIKPGNLLSYHGLRFVTSSLEKKKQVLKAEDDKALAGDRQKEEKTAADANKALTKSKEKMNGNRVSASAAYQIAASAASYLHSHTKSILRVKLAKSVPDENLHEGISGRRDDVDMISQDVASLMATTDSVTAVVAAKEEVKQAVADDLNSTRSSPCEWFVCDDDKSATRFFVIQGSESMSSWQANLLFEPIHFEGLDVLVHRGIYEAAKGMYKQMLPEVRAHVKSHGDWATFRFTGHSLGGSLSLLLNLMLLVRGEVPVSSLLPVITFGAPSIMCGGDRLLHELGLPQNHVRAITMHRDIVPRAFSCNYPNHVAKFLKAVNRNFRNHPCLNNQKFLYAPMGEFLVLQPDDNFSPNHYLPPSGSGLYLLSCPVSNVIEAEKQIRAAQEMFLNSPHPLEILSDRSAYGLEGTIKRDHDVKSYFNSVRNVIRQELNSTRKAQKEHHRRIWWSFLEPQGVNASIIVSRPITTGNMGRGQFNFSGVFRAGKESLKRCSRLVASQHMHLLVVLLLPAKLLILRTYSLISIH
ncbi:alpha/beta-hydrolase superfamily protein [Forsythia ovata]|uniref:Alpha/beta-hydrolase superfamily protein n=1 Tax=Forsythia ovata TaxID=205694 RepID=A0ABD1T4C8_9LAMI